MSGQGEGGTRGQGDKEKGGQGENFLTGDVSDWVRAGSFGR